VSWEARRLEQLLEEQAKAFKEQTKLFERLILLEAKAVILLQKLVDSQTVPTMPTPTAITVEVSS
jgi:hypothetical protein